MAEWRVHFADGNVVTIEAAKLLAIQRDGNAHILFELRDESNAVVAAFPSSGIQGVFRNDLKTS